MGKRERKFMLITCQFYARSLMSEETIQILLPDSVRKGTEEKVPVLYLLHGLMGNYADWLRYTALERYAKNYKVAIVMPSAQNTFYQNLPGARCYQNYIAEELPEFVQNVFPVSAKREENFMAGLSMGAYGTFYTSLHHLEKFGKIGVFSGPVDFYNGVREKRYQATYAGVENPFELVEDIGRDGDLYDLLDGISNEKLPHIFLSCGKQDFLYHEFCQMKEYLTDRKVSFFAQDGNGKHAWEYWDKQISDFLAWLPLEKRPDSTQND